MTKPRVLCVDDEAAILEGLELILGRKYQFASATSGAAALAFLEHERDVAVILSDLRMPQMDGAAFLAQARVLAPDAARILLTGHADLRAAISAINDGQIFRFLTKPSEPAALLAAIEAGCEQHRLVTGERELLEKTLRGSVQALVEALALANPVAFGRVARIKKTALALADHLDLEPRWQLEIAAMLWPLGLIGVSAETADRLFHGQPLDAAEREACARGPAIAEQLIAHIPRLEGVRAILKALGSPYCNTAHDFTHRAAAMLRAAIDLDTLEIQGNEPLAAIATLKARTDHDREVIAALASVRAPAKQGPDIRELPLAALHPGMVFDEDVRLVSGALVVARGAEVSLSFLAHARNFPRGALKPKLRVVVPPGL